MGWPIPSPRLDADNPLAVASAGLRQHLGATQDELGSVLGYCAGGVSGIETGINRGPKCMGVLLALIDYERRWQNGGGAYLTTEQFYNRLVTGVDDIDPPAVRRIRQSMGMTRRALSIAMGYRDSPNPAVCYWEGGHVKMSRRIKLTLTLLHRHHTRRARLEAQIQLFYDEGRDRFTTDALHFGGEKQPVAAVLGEMLREIEARFIGRPAAFYTGPHPYQTRGTFLGNLRPFDLRRALYRRYGEGVDQIAQRLHPINFPADWAPMWGRSND